jgi:hypothetical protein
MQAQLMVSELDRWRAAQQLIKTRGLEAALDAALRADEAIARGDPEAESLWLDIGRKIKALQQIPGQAQLRSTENNPVDNVRCNAHVNSKLS